MEICRECPHIQVGFVCGLCKCLMAIKVHKEKAKCPIGKW
jgi:hypothetical protein